MSVLEVAQLHITDGEAGAFEEAFVQAHQYLKAASGHLHSELLRATEPSVGYLLLVRWRSIEEHVTGFVGSEEFQAFHDLIWPFFSVEPDVEHFTGVEV